MTRKERYEQLADALIAVAKVDHYMVGITEPVREHELQNAIRELINRQNDLADNETDPDFTIIDLALDIAYSRNGMTIID